MTDEAACVHNWEEWTSASRKLLVCSRCPATHTPITTATRERIVKIVVELHHGPGVDAARFGHSWECECCLKAINDLSWLVSK